MEEKLYSPLNFYLRDLENLESYDDIHYWRDELTHAEAFNHIDAIQAFLADDRERYDHRRGLMEYHSDGSLKGKVHSLVPHIELHGDQLFMVAHLHVDESLTTREMEDLKSWWGGQLSDGWGEGLEQRAIITPQGDLYVEPWSASNSFFVATQAEFERRFPVGKLVEQNQPDTDALLTAIAKKHCHFETLESRRSDSLDFRDVSVWGMRAALKEAYLAGREHQRQEYLHAQVHAPEISPRKDGDTPTNTEDNSLLGILRRAQERVSESCHLHNHEAPAQDDHDPEL